MTPFSKAALLFFLLAYLTLALINPLLDPLNLKIRDWVIQTRNPSLRPFMQLMHHIHDLPGLLIQVFLVCMVLGIIFQDWRRATVLIGSMFFQTAIVGVTKHLTSIERPPHAAFYVFLTPGSYPSGHVASSLLFALLTPAALRPYLPLKIVVLLEIFLISLSLLTAYGRLFLDVHWATDILGGWLLALATYLISQRLL